MSVSFAEPEEVLRRGFILFPTTFSLEGYRYIFSTDTIVRSLFVTIGITVAGTLINLIFTSLLAYPLSRQDFDGRKLFMMLIVFTMLFNGGILPTFIVVKAMGLLNSYWALLIPNAISAFNLIVIVSFFGSCRTVWRRRRRLTAAAIRVYWCVLCFRCQRRCWRHLPYFMR